MFEIVKFVPCKASSGYVKKDKLFFVDLLLIRLEIYQYTGNPNKYPDSFSNKLNIEWTEGVQRNTFKGNTMVCGKWITAWQNSSWTTARNPYFMSTYYRLLTNL